MEAIKGEAISTGEIIKINNWTLAKKEESGDPLMLDTEIAQKLGYANPLMIRKLIKRMIEAGQLEVVYTQEITPSSKGGRKGEAYYLTEAQTLKVVARSKTEIADQILNEVIEVYLAYRKGLLLPAAPISQEPTITAAEVKALIKEQAAENNQQINALLGAVSQLVQVVATQQTAKALPPQTPDAYDFPALPPDIRARAVQQDLLEPRWYWLNEGAKRLKISADQFYAAVKELRLWGTKHARKQLTSKGAKPAWQFDDYALDEVRRFAGRRGWIV